MSYNRFLYNSALYNAGREEVGAVAKSLIQAHTGPHIQAVVGSDPSFDESGISFISDFTITEGLVRKPPAAFYFPDLKALISAVRAGQDDLGAFLKAVRSLDLPANISPVAFIPDLGAAIFAFIEADLPASILGKLAELDLGARLQIVQEDLNGIILGIEAPNLGGRVLSIPAPTLGAIIWAPLDLPAFLAPVQRTDLPGDIFGFTFDDLTGSMLGIPAPTLSAQLKGFAAAESNLPGVLSSRLESLLPASISSVIPGPNDLVGSIQHQGAFGNLIAFVRRASPDTSDLLATIGKSIGNVFDLPAEINFLSANVLPASIGAFALGRNDKFLKAALQPVHSLDILANISSNENLKDLPASIFSLFGTADLGAFLRAAETFVTAILTVSTYTTSDLRATIGRPDCAGGSASVLLSAMAAAQQAKDLKASILSFLESDLGAAINQKEVFYALDTIDVLFTPKADRPSTFLATDTINVSFSPFRGLNLGAFIQAVISNVDLPATITAQFPLPRVEPAVNTITAAELRPSRPFDTQEVRLQMEGQLLDYFYVHGTSDAFIREGSESWRINVRGFRPIADGLFGEFASARVCRLGNISKFGTLDEAIRSCIAAVIGLEGEANLPSSISASGGVVSIPASLSVSDVFSDLGSVVNRVFPFDLTAQITPDDLGITEIKAIVSPVVSSTSSFGASISGFGETDLGSSVTAVP